MSAIALDCSVSEDILYMAMELSTNKWGLAFSTGAARDPRIREVPARDVSRAADNRPVSPDWSAHLSTAAAPAAIRESPKFGGPSKRMKEIGIVKVFIR